MDTGEVEALIATLYATEKRLEELTLGEVDTFLDGEGRTFMLRGAREQVRRVETVRQASILNALPAHIVMLDGDGRILTVNEAWRRFARLNGWPWPEDDVTLNYLTVCDLAEGDGSSDAHEVAAGIRAVLAGTTSRFSFEYACHAPGLPRWFVLHVTPVSANPRDGAVVLSSGAGDEDRSAGEDADHHPVVDQ
jgi:PAS domain-containing protein